MIRKALIAAAFTAALSIWIVTADAATLTTSESAWLAGVGGATVTNTQTIDGVDNSTFFLPTVTSITLDDGQTIGLSTGSQVTPPNGFPYALSDGYAGDLLVPVTGTSITLTPSQNINALGFEVVPYSANFFGPFDVTVTLATGQTSTVSLPGGDLNTGMTDPQFFGFYGGPIASLTISTTDPNGIGFGNFVDVPEPASIALMLTGIGLMAGVRRRDAV